MSKELATKSAADVVLRKGLKDAPSFLSSPASNQWAFMRCVFRGEDPLHMRVQSREAFFLTRKGKKGIFEREITPKEEKKLKEAVHTLNPLLDPNKLSTGSALQILQSYNDQLLPESINTPPTEEGDGEKGDKIGSQDPDMSGTERGEGSDSLADDVKRAVDLLPAAQARVVKARWGLDGKGLKTHQQVAAEFGQTKQNIQQTEDRAFRKMRRNHRRLSDYIKE